MSWKLRVLISALLLTPAAALGLGLGEIRLNSALNQPLSAEIDLVAATPEELGALDANLASSEVFARYGLDRPAFLSSLEFTVGRRTGRPQRAAGAFARRDHRAVRLVPRRRQLAAWTPAPRVHGIARPAGHALHRRESGRRAGRGAGDDCPAAPASPATPEPEPAPAPTQRQLQGQRQPAPAVAAGSTYEVAHGDTLYGIAGSISGGDRQDNPAHDDRDVPRESRGVRRQHQPVARRRDPARADLRRHRRHRSR